MRGVLRAGVVAFACFGSTFARAEEKARGGLATFEWTRAAGAEGCLAEAEIVEDVERSLKRRVFTPTAGDRVLKASIAPTKLESGPGWHATIELSTQQGTTLGAREIELEGNDCREASSALVLAISLMADLPQLPEERGPSRQPSRESRRSEVRFRGSVAPAIVLDERAAVHPGLDLSLEIAPRPFVPILVDAFLQLQTQGSTRGQRYWLFGGTLAVSLCPLHLERSRLGLLGCIGPEATLYAAQGGGFANDQTAFSSTIGGLVQARASYAFTDRLRGFVLLGAIATPQKVDLIFGDPAGTDRSLGRTSYITGLGGLGVTLEF